MVYTQIRSLIHMARSKKNRNLAPFHDMGLMRFLIPDKRISDRNMAVSLVPLHLTASILIFADLLFVNQHQNGCLIFVVLMFNNKDLRL